MNCISQSQYDEMHPEDKHNIQQLQPVMDIPSVTTAATPQSTATTPVYYHESIFTATNQSKYTQSVPMQ